MDGSEAFAPKPDRRGQGAAQPLATSPAPAPRPLVRKVILFVILPIAALLGLLISLTFILGFLREFSIPSDVMAPAMASGDKFMMEGFTFLLRKPRRGDIVIFKTDGISPTLQSGILHVRRVAGVPGDKLQIKDGKLFVNDAEIPPRNDGGDVPYPNYPDSSFLANGNDNVTVPADHYFLLSDNSPRGKDSRYWGFVPAGNILGRPWYRVTRADKVEIVR